MGCGNDQREAKRPSEQPVSIEADNNLNILQMPGIGVQNASKSFKYNRKEDYLKFESPV